MNKKIITLIKAAEIADVHLTTIRYWALNFGIGVKINSKWHVDQDKLDAMIKARQHLQIVKDT